MRILGNDSIAFDLPGLLERAAGHPDRVARFQADVDPGLAIETLTLNDVAIIERCVGCNLVNAVGRRVAPALRQGRKRRSE
jgi:hypothetical protein